MHTPLLVGTDVGTEVVVAIREHPLLSSKPTCEWTPNLTTQWSLYVVEISNLQHNWQVYL